MTENKIYKEVSEILNSILKTGGSSPQDTPILGEGGVMDSVSVINLIALCNEKFVIDVIGDDLSLDCLNSVGALVKHIEDLMK